MDNPLFANMQYTAQSTVRRIYAATAFGKNTC